MKTTAIIRKVVLGSALFAVAATSILPAIASALDGAGAVQRASDRFERDPQLRSRGWWHRLPHDEIGMCEFDGVVPRLSETPGDVFSASPMLGADTHQVMLDVLGMTPEEVTEHEEMGVFM